ncbi:hypothetical protein EJB05_10991, partial [Eragrostis curvula]
MGLGSLLSRCQPNLTISAETTIPEGGEEAAQPTERRRRMEEEQVAVAHSADKPESSLSEKKPEGRIDSPEPEVVPSSDDEDDEAWDLFAPMSEAMARRLRKRAEEIAAIPVAERRRRERERELAWQKWNEEDVRAHQHEWLHRHEIRASRFRDEWMADWSRYASFEDINFTAS